jgi:putative peptidoglycan lipid II flippase
VVGVFGVLVYLAVALLLITPLGMLGLVLANSFQLGTHALIMLYLTHRFFDGLRGQGLATTTVKVMLASAVTGAVVFASMPFLSGVAAFFSTWDELIAVVAGGALGVVIYGVMIWLLRLEDVGYLWAMLTTRLSPGRKADGRSGPPG